MHAELCGLFRILDPGRHDFFQSILGIMKFDRIGTKCIAKHDITAGFEI